MLTGEGSDEMLAGYNRYRVTAYNARLGAAIASCVLRARRGVRRALEALPTKSRLGQRSRAPSSLAGRISMSSISTILRCSRAPRSESCSRQGCGRACGGRSLRRLPRALERVRGRPLLAQLLYADVKTYLQELLMKQDQMSMAASIESRVPFLDHPLAEWVAALPQRMKLRGRTTKWILRRDAGTSSDAILERHKMGFPVPVGSWLRGQWRPLLDEYVTGRRARDRSFFDADAVQSSWASTCGSQSLGTPLGAAHI